MYFSPNPFPLASVCLYHSLAAASLCYRLCSFGGICQSVQWIRPFTESRPRGGSLDSPISHLQLFSPDPIPHRRTRASFPHRGLPSRSELVQVTVGTRTRALHSRCTGTALQLQWLANTWLSRTSTCGSLQFQNRQETKKKNTSPRVKSISRHASRHVFPKTIR